jgi:hypothetical protein
VDGKTLPGAKHPPDGRQVHLLAAMDHATRAVVAQHQVDGAPGEVPGFRPLLADLDLADMVVTADALQTHHDAAEFLVVKQAHYLFCVKATSPPPAALRRACLASCSGLGPPARPGPRPRRDPHRVSKSRIPSRAGRRGLSAACS